MTIDPIKQWRETRQAARDAADAEARDRHNERQRERALRAYTAAGGDEGDFKKEWPAIRRELLRGETITTMRGDYK
jgi:hypothetical protein